MSASMQEAMKKIAAKLAAVSSLAKADVYVGVPRARGDRSDSSASNAAVAAAHEFGTRNIPERSFLRRTLKEQHDKIVQLEAANVRDLLRDKVDAHRAADRVGVFVTGEVHRTITDGDFTPLAEATVEAKGSSKPLIDSGQLRQSITFEVRNGSE